MEPTKRHHDRRAVEARADSAREPGEAADEPAGSASERDAESESGRSSRVSPRRVEAPAASTHEHGGEPDALHEQLCAGTLVDGRYRVDETLGRGAMGVVVAATHVHLHERVALKFLDTRIRVTVDDFYARFVREARVSAKLRGEHVARVIDVGRWQDRYPFMVMDHLTGSDLRKTLNAAGGVLPIELAIEYIVQLCEGMAEAHALGIVHRDLKPSNILITKRPDGSDLLKILDFGISKWSAQEGQTADITLTGVMLGSPKYMAPEQLFGASSVDARADVWSIGAMLYELLTGRRPFDAPTLAQICRELALAKAPPPMSGEGRAVPPAIEAVVLRCLQHELSARVANVAELAGSLLEASGSPHAAAVRLRLEAVLTTHSERALVTSTSAVAGQASAPSLPSPLAHPRARFDELPAVCDAAAELEVWPDVEAAKRSARRRSLAALTSMALRHRRWLAVGLFAALLAACVLLTMRGELARRSLPRLGRVQLHAVPSLAPSTLGSRAEQAHAAASAPSADAAVAATTQPSLPRVDSAPDAPRTAATPNQQQAARTAPPKAATGPRVLPGRGVALPAARRALPARASESRTAAAPPAGRDTVTSPLEERL